MKQQAIAGMTELSVRTREGSVSISRAPRRKTTAQITAQFPSGAKWEIFTEQNGKPAAKNGARRKGVTQVIARPTPQGMEYISVRTGRRLTPPGNR